jgi:hypothetical protein
MKNSAGATDAQIASTEKSITAMSKHSAIADDVLRPALGNLVRATGDVTKSQDLLQIAVDASAATGKDLGSITEAMGKAANGSTGGLQKLGIAVKGAHGEALTADQVFQNMATTFKGQAAVAADSAAGKMANAKIQFGEFQEQIGGYLLPVVSTMATFFTTTLIPAISGLSDWVAKNKDMVVAAFIGFGVVVGAVVIPAFITWAAAAGAAALATLVAAAPFIAIGAVIAGVAFLIIKNWDSIVAATKAAWDFVFGAIKFVWDWVQANWPILLGILLGPIALAAVLIVKNWDTIKEGAAAVWDFIRNGWNSLIGFFTSIPGRLAGIFSGMWDGIWEAFKGAINMIIRAWNNFEIKLPEVDTHIPFVGKIGGFALGTPDIPTLAQGGLMTSSGLVFAHAGEVISPAPAGSTGPALHIENAYFNDAVDVDLLMAKAEFAISAGRL